MNPQRSLPRWAVARRQPENARPVGRLARRGKRGAEWSGGADDGVLDGTEAALQATGRTLRQRQLRFRGGGAENVLMGRIWTEEDEERPQTGEHVASSRCIPAQGIKLVRSELAQVILRHHLSGNTVFQSFFIETMIHPLASA